MPAVATGSESNVPASRADVQITIPLDGDPRSASSVNTPLQRLADYCQRIVKQAGFLDIASAWTTLQTFTRRIVVEKAGGDANPALTVTGGAQVDTLTATGALGYTTTKTRHFRTHPYDFLAGPGAPDANTGTIHNGHPAVTRSSGSDLEIRQRILLPSGAALTDVAVWVGVLTGTPSVSVSLVSTVEVAGPTTALTELIGAGGAGHSFAPPDNPAQGVWVSVPLAPAAAAYVVPDDVLLLLTVTLPEGGIYKGAHITYAQTEVRPAV